MVHEEMGDLAAAEAYHEQHLQLTQGQSEHDEASLEQAAESHAKLLQVCTINAFSTAALITTLDWLSCLPMHISYCAQ